MPVPTKKRTTLTPDTSISEPSSSVLPQQHVFHQHMRTLAQSAVRIEEINVPRDRAGQFHTQAYERYSCYEPHIAEGLTQMNVAGVSTHNVGEVAEPS